MWDQRPTRPSPSRSDPLGPGKAGGGRRRGDGHHQLVLDQVQRSAVACGRGSVCAETIGISRCAILFKSCPSAARFNPIASISTRLFNSRPARAIVRCFPSRHRVTCHHHCLCEVSTDREDGILRTCWEPSPEASHGQCTDATSFVQVSLRDRIGLIVDA